MGGVGAAPPDVARDEHGRVKMGVKQHGCDTGTWNLDIDWDVPPGKGEATRVRACACVCGGWVGGWVGVCVCVCVCTCEWCWCLFVCKQAHHC